MATVGHFVNEQGRYPVLIALKRSGEPGPRRLDAVKVVGDPDAQLITLETRHTLAALNFSGESRCFEPDTGWVPCMHSVPPGAAGMLQPFAALILKRA